MTPKPSKPFSFAAIGDLHLDSSRLSSLFGERKALDMQIGCLEDIACQAVDEGIKSLFLLGDVFDKKPSLAALVALLDFFHEMEAKDARFGVFPGNHDVLGAGATTLDLLAFLARKGKAKNVKVFREPFAAQTVSGVIDVLPWPACEPVSDSPLACLGHFGVKGALMDNGIALREEDDPGKEIPGNEILWVLGHLHTGQMLGSNKVYPGTPYQTKFGENEDKSWLRVDLEGRGKWKLDTRKIDKPFTLDTFRAKSARDYERMPKPVKNTRLRVVYDPRTAPPPDDLSLTREDVAEAVPIGDNTAVDMDAVASGMEETKVDGFTPLAGLEEFLKERGMKKRQIAKARELVKDAMRETGSDEA